MTVHTFPFRAIPAAAPDRASEALAPLGELLLGESNRGIELPSILDLTAAVSSLADGSEAKVLLPLGTTPLEYAFVRSGAHLLVSCYDTSAAPEVFVVDRRLSIQALLDACGAAAQEVARTSADPTARVLYERLATRATSLGSATAHGVPVRAVRREGGAARNPGDTHPLAFGFSARIRPSASSRAAMVRADVHAMLFPGELWAFVRGVRCPLLEGPILLAVQRTLAAARSLIDAWEAGRTASVRVSMDDYRFSARLDHERQATVTVGRAGAQSVSAAGMDLPSAVQPILRLAADLLRAVFSVDRSQHRNLRLRAMRDEVRALRRIIRARTAATGFTNPDPDRLRWTDRPASVRPFQPAAPPVLRYGERWRVALEEVDAASTFLCGDRVVVGSPRHMVALCRDRGEVIWARTGHAAATFMAGTVLLRLGPTGRLELCDVSDGEAYATTQVAPRAGTPAVAVAGGGAIPPMAIVSEAHNRLVAIDLRTAEPRWHFVANGHGDFHLQRTGRVLVVVSGDTPISAVDVATGEVAWRFSDGMRMCQPVAVCRDVVIAVSGELGTRHANLYGIDLYSGQIRWRQELEGPTLSEPAAAAGMGVIALGEQGGARLIGFDAVTGQRRWNIADPGMGTRGAVLGVDQTLIVNPPSGEVVCLSAESGEALWRRELCRRLADDVPRRLEPILRGGALYVPSSAVHVLRPTDGASIGEPLPCDLIPDLLRVDERNWAYVVEESGHLGAYAPLPYLSLVKGPTPPFATN